jgi:hypothetical protein
LRYYRLYQENIFSDPCAACSVMMNALLVLSRHPPCSTAQTSPASLHPLCLYIQFKLSLIPTQFVTHYTNAGFQHYPLVGSLCPCSCMAVSCNIDDRVFQHTTLVLMIPTILFLPSIKDNLCGVIQLLTDKIGQHTGVPEVHREAFVL